MAVNPVLSAPEPQGQVSDAVPTHREDGAQTEIREPVDGPTTADIWNAHPDPLPEELSMSAIRRVRIALESRENIVYPARPSPFVALAEREGKVTSVDLRTGKPVGQIDMGFRPRHCIAFSPDGRYFAAQPHRPEDSVQVWCFETGNQAAQVTLEDGPIDALSFADKDQLVAVYRDGYDMKVETWDILSGEKVAQYATRGVLGATTTSPGKSFAVSPGGRYGAMLVRTTLHVCDLQTGELVGQSTLPPDKGAEPIGPLAFSPDGNALAGLLCRTFRSRLACWNFSTGKLVTLRTYGGHIQSTTQRESDLYIEEFEWLPGRGGLVIAGELLLDPSTGNRVYQFRGDGPRQPRRFVQANRALVVLKQEDGPDQLTDVPVPSEEIAQLTKRLRSSILVQLPPVTQTSLTHARRIHPSNDDIPWRVEPDPPPAIEVPAKTPVKLRIPNKPVRLAGRARGVAVVQRMEEPKWGTGTPHPPGPILPEPINMIEAYDLSTGDSLCQMALPERHRLTDVSPDGTLMLSCDRDSLADTRLDVWSIPQKRHLLGWRPSCSETRGSEYQVRWTQFVDNSRVLTFTSTGELVLWRLPQCQAEWVLPEVASGGTLSPGRRHVQITLRDQRSLILEAATGEVIGQLEKAVHLPYFVSAFRSDGRALATARIQQPIEQEPGGYIRVVTWDMSTGKISDDFAMPPVKTKACSTSQLSWLGPRHLLLFDEWVCDLSSHCLGWRYNFTVLDVPRQPRGQFDGRHWYVCTASTPGQDRLSDSFAAFLVARQLPSDQTLAAMARLRQTARPLLYPGCKVRIETHFERVPHGKELIHAETARLSEAGLIVADEAEIAFVVRASVRRGKPIKSHGRTLSSKEVACDRSFVDATGKRFWHHEAVVPLVLGNVQEDFCYANENADFMFRLYLHHLGGRRPPTYLFDGPAPALAGHTKLTLNGEEPVEEPKPSDVRRKHMPAKQ